MNNNLLSMKHFYILIPAILIALCTACNGSKSESAEGSVQELLPDKPAEVTVMQLVTTNFEYELVSNGKISARSMAEVKFQTTEVISEVFVKNGESVTKGQKLATLNTRALDNRLKQAKDALDRSRLEYQDVLIGQGYKLDGLGEVPEEIAELARVKSGYNTSLTQHAMAEHDREQATLFAPIDGVVANLFAKTNTLSSPSEIFCNIIDTRSLEVDFTVLENELGLIQTGNKVSVSPFSMVDVIVEGRVAEVNPWVNENGMVRVKASVNYHPRLVEGMNVRVSIFRSAGKQWVVPKTAVVLRTGREVVFTLAEDKAIWNYVDTGLENATDYTITSESLKEGDIVITGGNINLAHESPVIVAINRASNEE